MIGLHVDESVDLAVKYDNATVPNLQICNICITPLFTSFTDVVLERIFSLLI